MLVRKTLAAASVTTLMTAGLGFATAAPASAATNNNNQGGLVNVNVQDVEILQNADILNNNDVLVGVCADVNAAILAAAEQSAAVTCDNTIG